MKAWRAIAMPLSLAALAGAGWLVVQTTRADGLARTDPDAALRLDADHPQALLAHAWRQMANGDDAGATRTARHLLRTSPGQGDAFAVIALAAARQHRPDASRLLDIAVRRAPRVPQVRAQLAASRLHAGDVAGALAQLDALLRIKPSEGAQLYPAMAQQALDRPFADALAATLARQPPWRRRFLAALDAKGPGAAVDNVYASLQKHGGLSAEETRRRLDGLIAKGRWGDAFASWFGLLDPVPARLPSVRNGGFEDEIDGIGFGWRNDPKPGVFTDVEPGEGTRGSRAAHVQFIDLPAAGGNLRQALLLAPGRYRLSLRARAEFLQSDQGLQWVVTCDKGPQVAATELLEGSFGWRTISADFDIPLDRCPGQWLELHNPAVAGSAQGVSGDLWVDDVAITSLGAR
jgi:hypothetical protein